MLVVHSWWGLTRSFTVYADALASRGFLVGCADLYDGAVATTEAGVRRLRTQRREPASARRSMERAIADHGLPYRAYDYPGTEHWFAECSADAYEPAAAARALGRTVSFLRSGLA